MKNVLVSAITAVVTTLLVVFVMHSMGHGCCDGSHEGCSKHKTECSKDGKKCTKEGKKCDKDCKKPCCAKKDGEAHSCKPGCTKPCCAKKAADSLASEETETVEVEEIIEEVEE